MKKQHSKQEDKETQKPKVALQIQSKSITKMEKSKEEDKTNHQDHDDKEQVGDDEQPKMSKNQMKKMAKK